MEYNRLFLTLAEDLMQLKNLRPYPIMEVEIKSDFRLFVKVEHDNAGGSDPLRSIKRKPACMMGLFADELNPKRDIWVSASSGNFALELGLLANEMDKKVFAVVPPKTSRRRIETLRSLGVNVVVVSEEEYDLCPREFTVFMVRALAKNMIAL
jgi:cysteine synthase